MHERQHSLAGENKRRLINIRDMLVPSETGCSSRHRT